MRVLVIIEGLWPPATDIAGGSILYKLQNELGKLGIDIHVLTAIRSWTAPNWEKWVVEEKERNGIHYHWVDIRPWDRGHILPFLVSKIAFLRKIKQLHSKYEFDIVHDYSSGPMLIRLTGLYKKRLDVSAIHTLCTYNTSVLGSFRLVGGQNSVDRIICVTRHMCQQLLRYGCSESKVLHLPLGVDAARFSRMEYDPELKDSLDIDKNKLVVLFIGPLEERKGAFTFVEAAKLVLSTYSEAVFVIATFGLGGVDKQHQRHKARIQKIVTGYEKSFKLLEGQQNIPELMALADVFVLPQTTPHGTLGYPLVLLEAMVAGKAIIASDTAGVNELIVDGQNGILVTPGDSGDLSCHLYKVISSEYLRQQISSDENFVEIKDVGQIAAELLEIYTSLLTMKSGVHHKGIT